MIAVGPDSERAAADVFRSDLYRRALAGEGVAMPGASMKVEGALGTPLGAGTHSGSLTLAPDRFFDGRSFDPDAIPGYLRGLESGAGD
jgi:NitT/TauT family transport system ATP-binding protein